ncbi:DNA phosphorothioation-dependent restriction protein DptH [Clostridium paraputrificum]|uniref:DNA phosphorothioation-dependent restriction protein DptH n=1 Tax=Clostridium paraputrificum TaxID=29363 RepID=UPI00374E6FFB
MLDQFYSYLSEKINDFFRMNPLIPGSKYNIQFETEDQVRSLYESARNNSFVSSYEYKDNEGKTKYDSYQIDFNGVQLIVAATIKDVQPDFLTRLRNMVGVEPGYERKAILFIHNTTLDSIIGGTESFTKEGMPFHIDSIQKDIKAKVINSSFSRVEKAIIDLSLERKKNVLFQDNNSIFEYKEILEIVNKEYISREEYRNFGLFFDSKLGECTEKELEKKLDANINYFTIVDEIHNYGNPETELEKYFDENGIDKLKGADWKDVDYKDVEKSIEEKKKIKPLEYLSGSIEWDKEEGTSKAKMRVRNIIVFNEDGQEEVELEFPFDEYLKKEFLNYEGEIEASVSGKKIKAVIKDREGKSKFYKIVYRYDNIKFEFKIFMVRCNHRYLDSIKSRFSIVIKKNNSYISIKTNESSIVFNEFADNEVIQKIEFNNDRLDVNDDEKTIVKISENFEYENDDDLIRFDIKVGTEYIPIGIIGTNEKIGPIEGMNVWKLKREKESDFKVVGDNKIQHGTKDFFTRDEFRKSLELEKKIVELEGMYFIESADGVEVSDISVKSEVREAYNNIINYYKISKKLPSLTYINEDLKVLYEKFIKSYLDALNDIEEGSYLTKEQKNLFKIGSIRREIDDREIMFSPLHPLNIAYQLHITDKLKNEELSDEVVKKFTSTYLLPYIMSDDEKLFIPMEQQHSPEWKFFVDENLPRYKSSREFVSKLVNEKIEEFVGHFKYLFEMGNSAPIRINLINTGDSKEILQGIFKYYVKELRNSKTGEVLPIDLFIYSNKNVTNAFEEVAFNEDINSLKEIYNLDLNINNMSEEDVLNMYREKVHFYTKRIEEGVEYAHITFLEMNNEAKSITSKMGDIPSGIILDGLISGVPSVFLGDSYRTGFGIKYANTESNLMNIAIKLNALNAATSGEPFNTNQCKAISVPNKSKETLEQIYEASHWVTFIDPKVDLNFFKNDPDAKDLLIIHYSDQYTTAGGYDAITVTRKSGPYQRIIEEFLTKKGIENAHDYSPGVINMFNAINGDWLLRLLSSKSHFPKEKMSILSAIKLALAEFRNDNIIWVPISLEEVLRVSGGAGLKQSEGFLSAKNLGFDKNGATSDDILLVGIEQIEGKVIIHYYPIEVKIGENNNTYVQKGIDQAKATKQIFNKTLLTDDDGGVTNSQKVYRNFLMQLVVTSAEKLNLYNVCQEENWTSIIDSDLRRKLLNEEYIISSEVKNTIGEAAVISFKKGVTFKDIRVEDNVMVIEMSEDDGINFITKTVSEIKGIVDGIEIDSTEIDVDYKDVTYSDEEELDNEIDPLKEDNSVSVDVTKEVAVEEKAKCEISNNCYRNMEIVFGVNERNNKEVLWCPNDTNKLLHTNTGIIGTMGTGKTQFTKSMITQIYRESKYNIDSKKVGILIFDYKGDYNKTKQDFIKATDAKIFELFHLPFNPLTVIKSENSKPMLPLHTANSLKETLAKAFGLGIKQETLLRDLIMEAYEKRGIIKNKPDTWDKPAPTLKDVFDIYVDREDLKEDSLYAAFSNLIDFEIFEPDPFETQSLFDLIDGVTVIDLSGYDPGIQNLVVAITLDLFYSQMQAYGHSKIDGQLRQLNKIVLVDEADNFLSKDFPSLKKILKEGREFGVGTVLSTQLLSHFNTGENEYANYILSWVVHRVDDLSNKDVKRIFNTQSKADEDRLVNTIKSLNKHYSLVKMGDSDRAIFMKDRAFWELLIY